MDRRQRKSREAIFKAFTELLSNKHVSKITVGEIIEKADVGRATFYGHFESKELLLKELLAELLCHIFDKASEKSIQHKHFFECETGGSVFQHLFEHFSNNDNNILKLISGENFDIFLPHLTNGIKALCEADSSLKAREEQISVPHALWLDHASSAFVNTLTYWNKYGRKESPSELEKHFYTILGIN